MRSLFILGLSLVMFSANQLSALAQTRQVTNVELRKLRQELQKAITLSKKNNSTFIQDHRTAKEKQDRESFIRAWSKIEPGLAPFLGWWWGYEDMRYIYPSNTKGHVCVISSNDGGYGSFATGIFSNGVIQTSRDELLLKERAYLGSASLEKGRFVRNYDIPLNSPKPLEPLTKLFQEISEFQHKSEVYQQFNAAGCTNLKPGQQSNTSINTINYSKQIPGIVVFSNTDSANRRYTRVGKMDRNGVYVVGKKDIEQLSPHLWFSLFLFQDGLVKPAFIEKGKIKYISQEAYLYIKLIKVSKQRYVLHTLHDYYKGGDDYYDIDLRNINKPFIKQIDLAIAQRLGKTKKFSSVH